MTATAVAERVRNALARELRRDPDSITPPQALREDLGLNSLDAIELMFKVEEEFDIEIPDADLQRLRTVADLTAYLEERLSGAESPSVPAPAPAVAAAPPAAPHPDTAPAAVPPKVRAQSSAKRPTKSRKGPTRAGTSSPKRSRA
jgi:acyl carrier protein